jgi:hypothetical protein
MIRVARWYIFKPKISIWVNFWGPLNGKCWYTFGPLGNLLVIWYIFLRFGKLYQEKSGKPVGDHQNYFTLRETRVGAVTSSLNGIFCTHKKLTWRVSPDSDWISFLWNKLLFARTQDRILHICIVIITLLFYIETLIRKVGFYICRNVL